MLERWQEIAAAERALDDRLLIGLVGGTGVGKSTLINALAAAEISSMVPADRVTVVVNRASASSLRRPA